MAVEHWAPEIGGQFWWNGVFFALLFAPLMLIVGKKLSEEHRNYMLYGMGIYQLGVKFANQISPILSDSYILATDLPLQLCSISGILAGVVVFYRKQILFEFLYFFGIVGFIHSILTPEFTGGTPTTWNIFDYYVGHSMLFIVPIFLMMFYGFKLRKNAWWTSFIYLQLIVVIVSQANVIIGNGANYMYLAKAPIADNIFILQDPYHILGFELAALAHFYLLDLVARKVFK